MIIFRSISAMSLLSVSLSFLFFSLLFFLIVKFITVDWRRLEWNFWNMPISNADKARAWLPHFACGSGLFSWRQTATAVWCCLYSNRKQKERLYTFSPLWQHFSLSLICCLTPSVLFASGVQPLNGWMSVVPQLPFTAHHMRAPNTRTLSLPCMCRVEQSADEQPASYYI